MSSEAVVEVSFGFPSLIGFTFMSGMINKFKEVFPKAQVFSMYEAQLSSFLPAIRDGRLDSAIGTLSAEMKLQDLHVEPLFESEFVLVAGRFPNMHRHRRAAESLKTNSGCCHKLIWGTTANCLLRYKKWHQY